MSVESDTERYQAHIGTCRCPETPSAPTSERCTVVHATVRNDATMHALGLAAWADQMAEVTDTPLEARRLRDVGATLRRLVGVVAPPYGVGSGDGA